MFRVILWSDVEESRAFRLHLKRISFRLREATAAALKLSGPEEVSFMLVVAPCSSGGRTQLLCVADPRLALEQIMHWRNTLGVVWADLASDLELADISPLFMEEVEIWLTVPTGKRALFRNGQLIKD